MGFLVVVLKYFYGIYRCIIEKANYTRLVLGRFCYSEVKSNQQLSLCTVTGVILHQTFVGHVTCLISCVLTNSACVNFLSYVNLSHYFQCLSH